MHQLRPTQFCRLHRLHRLVHFLHLTSGPECFIPYNTPRPCRPLVTTHTHHLSLGALLHSSASVTLLSETVNHKVIGITFPAPRLLRNNMTLVHPIAVIIQLSTLEEYNQSSSEPTIPIRFRQQRAPLSHILALPFPHFLTVHHQRYTAVQWFIPAVHRQIVNTPLATNQWSVNRTIRIHLPIDQNG